MTETKNGPGHLPGYPSCPCAVCAAVARLEDLGPVHAVWENGILPFSEDNPLTWDEENLPAGYEWQWVDDYKAHLFTPEGRDLSAEYPPESRNIAERD